MGLLLTASLASFLSIARKGRLMRRNQPLPPPAERAYLRWEEDGHPNDLEVFTPFYMGSDPANQVVLPLSRAAHEICIFYHHSRFAFQALPEGGPILVNGEENPAGYLWDGDHIRVGQRTFRFVCY